VLPCSITLQCSERLWLPVVLERYRGYAAALEARELRVDAKPQVDAIPSEQSGYDAAKILLERNARFDAILIAIGAMKALHARGLRVPDDVLVTGCDDIRWRGSSTRA
jgi:DNA-binding LacI/PurR family transcriptional regulator